MLENLICAGAFDDIARQSRQKLHELEKIMELAAEHKKDAATGQMGLFGNAAAEIQAMNNR